MIRREQLRLRRTFRRLLLLSVASPAALQACSSSSNNSAAPGQDAGSDATITTDGRSDVSTGDVTGNADSSEAASDAGPPTDAFDESVCQPGQPYFNDASYAQLPDSAADSQYYACYAFVDLPCGTLYKHDPQGGFQCYIYLDDCMKICNLDGGFVDCIYWQDAGCTDGSVTVVPGQLATVACGLCNGVGRRPAGLRKSSATRAPSALGAYFADASRLEAASVHAFERLRDELRALGAPPELIRMAERSARDEVRHARVTGRLARRHGAVPAPARVKRGALRALERVAHENAVEGCVRETFGAMVATWQAARARDPQVRKSMVGIARDETRHAALAWAVARWAESRLDEHARSRIARARRAAVRALEKDVGVALPASASREAGLPSALEARALIAGLSEVWT
jgi:hypothetical protein